MRGGCERQEDTTPAMSEGQRIWEKVAEKWRDHKLENEPQEIDYDRSGEREQRWHRL
jgi:hypothetical protein